MSRLFFVALFALIWNGTPSRAADFEQYCNLAGFSTPMIQTIIVLEEQHVFPEAGKSSEPRNGQWRRFIGNVLFADAPNLEQNFLPREHVTIFIARKDGAGTRTVFSGCLPLFSLSERTRIAQSAGYIQSVNTFFGTGAVATAKKDRDLFKIAASNRFRTP